MPKWIKPQLTRLVDEAQAGGGWVHEIKYDGYRMHARIDDRAAGQRRSRRHGWRGPALSEPLRDRLRG